MMKLKEKLKKRGGFTLIEMLLVVAIVAILVVISIPMMNNSLNEARKAADDANERAAKAEAAIVWLTADVQEADEWYYDAKEGTLKDTFAEVSETYGKFKGEIDNKDVDHTDSVVYVEVDDEGKIKTSWANN